MLIKLFKNNNPSAFIFLPLFAIIMWLPCLFSDHTILINNTMPLFDSVVSSTISFKLFSKIITLILIISEAFLLNYIVTKNEVDTKPSYLPALFYIVFMCNSNDMLVLNPLLFANLFLLLSINKLLTSYRKDNAFSEAFDAGFLLSIATLFYFPCIIFIPIIGVGLILFRPFNIREWIIAMIGLFVPYCFVITYYFWNNSLQFLWKEKIISCFYHYLPSFTINSNLYSTIGIFLTILFLSFGKLFSGINIGSQKTKKARILFIWFFFLSIIGILFATKISTIEFSIIIIPSTVFASNYFLTTKKHWWGEALFLLFLIIIATNHF